MPAYSSHLAACRRGGGAGAAWPGGTNHAAAIPGGQVCAPRERASAQPPTDAACRRTDGAGAAGLDSVRAAAAAGLGAAGRTTRAWWGTGACVGGGVSTQGARIAAAANAYSSVISSMVLAVGLPAHPAQPPITHGNHAWPARMREAAAQGLHHKRASMSVLFVVVAVRARETHKGH